MEKAKILIVDDTPVNLQAIAAILEENGYEFGFAISGKQALDSLEIEMPDLILLDIMMPEMDGMEVCRRLKANPKTKDIPVVFLTAKSKKEDIVAGFDIGGADYVTKPFHANELLARVSTQVRLKKATEALKEMNANKDKFFSIIAHDLKGPFQAVLGITETMYDNFDRLSAEQIKTFVTDIRDSSQKFYAMLDNLLIWVRIQMGRTQAIKESFLISNLVNDLFSIINPLAKAKDIELINNIDANLSVFIDKNMISRIIQNLFTNAIKFTQIGGKVIIYNTFNQNQIEITVEDNGSGIKQAIKDKLFKIGENVSTTGTAGELGTGLGLILCKELIELNNGSIKVETEENKGSKFTISIPKIN